MPRRAAKNFFFIQKMRVPGPTLKWGKLSGKPLEKFQGVWALGSRI